MAAKLKIKSGDNVKVIAGKYKGEQGKVLSVLPEKNKAVVEGINIVKRHTKPSAKHTEGGIIEKEAPIHMSNIQLVVDGQTTKVGRRMEDGKLKRFAKKTNKLID